MSWLFISIPMLANEIIIPIDRKLKEGVFINIDGGEDSVALESSTLELYTPLQAISLPASGVPRKPDSMDLVSINTFKFETNRKGKLVKLISGRMSSKSPTQLRILFDLLHLPIGGQMYIEN